MVYINKNVVGTTELEALQSIAMSLFKIEKSLSSIDKKINR